MTVKSGVLRIYFLLRLPFIYILSLISNPFVRRPGSVSKILLIRLDRIGDFVLALPVIDGLRSKYPEAKVSVLVRPYLADLARMIRSIDNVIVYDNFISTVQRLRKESFAIAIDMLCDYTLRPAVLALFSGAPERVGFEIGFRGILFTKTMKPGGKSRHMVEINLDILKALDAPVKERIPSIVLEGIQAKRSAVVAIHPGGYYPSQRWPSERFSELAKKIADLYDVEIVIIGGPGDRELVQRIAAQVPGTRVKVVSAGLKDLALILGRSALLVCNNSGPLHLAAALGTPTVSMMGPTDPVLWWPKGERQVVIRKQLPCSPCGIGRCNKHDCMELITVDEVLQEVKGILDTIDEIKKH